MVYSLNQFSKTINIIICFYVDFLRVLAKHKRRPVAKHKHKHKKHLEFIEQV
jgi:hypothetical protein